MMDLNLLFTQWSFIDVLIPAALSAVVAYFLGCFNGSVLVSKYILKDDVRAYGSGNAGLTNFYRTFGGPLTAAVILTDVIKAVISVLVAMWAAGHFLVNDPMVITLAKYWGGMWCIIGHMYPCIFNFKGGKGVLSGGAIAIMIDWRIALVVWGGFIILAVLTKWVSLGSCWAGFSFPFASWFVYHNWLILIFAIISGGLLLWKHRSNMQRILKGTESKFAFRKKS